MHSAIGHTPLQPYMDEHLHQLIAGVSYDCTYL